MSIKSESPTSSGSVMSTLSDSSIFDNAEEISCEIYYESSSLAGKHEKIKLTYFDRLNNFGIDPNVTEWIRNKIDSSNRKTSKINDEHLYTFIYSGYKSLGIPCDPIALAQLMNINLSKSEVSKMLSGTYGKESCVSELSTTIPIIVISPKQYVREIINFFVSHYSNSFDTEQLICSVEFFIESLCTENRFLVQENPKNMASAASFYYVTLINSKIKINKSHFIDRDINERLFTRCLTQLKETFERIYREDNMKACSLII